VRATASGIARRAPRRSAAGHGDPVSLDALCARPGHALATLQAQWLELALATRVARLPGGLFQQIAQG